MDDFVAVASQITPAHVIHKENDNIGRWCTVQRGVSEQEAVDGEADGIHETIKE